MLTYEDILAFLDLTPEEAEAAGALPGLVPARGPRAADPAAPLDLAAWRRRRVITRPRPATTRTDAADARGPWRRAGGRG